MRVLCSRIRALFMRRQIDAWLDEEVQAHLDALANDYARRGLTNEQAQLAARREFGGIEPMKETYRDRRGIPLIETIAQDVRYGLRALGRHRWFCRRLALVAHAGHRRDDDRLQRHERRDVSTACRPRCRFARDLRAIGSVLRARDRDCAIVGVTPPLTSMRAEASDHLCARRSADRRVSNSRGRST
jgi:hypothetical protein